MKQALHIFAKDARHFWPEITVSLVITAVFAWTYRYTWMADMVPGIPKLQYLQKLAEIVAGLVPVSWWILITRAVHAESLVGDRQWWITKPYEWPQLLGSKLLFLAAFVLLPFCVAQCVLLEVAGFHWFEYMPGLGFSLVLVLGILVGPHLRRHHSCNAPGIHLPFKNQQKRSGPTCGDIGLWQDDADAAGWAGCGCPGCGAWRADGYRGHCQLW